MASKVEIGRRALNHIGDRYDISSIDEEQVEAEALDLIFDDVRDALLRGHDWNFARKYLSQASLEGTAATIPGNWTYMFQYPSDCLRVIRITNPLGDDKPKVPFETAINADDTRVVLCNLDTEIELVYTKRIEDTQQYDPEFSLALSYALASAMALGLTGELSIKQELANEAARIAGDAEESNANEGTEPEPPESPSITARL